MDNAKRLKEALDIDKFAELINSWDWDASKRVSHKSPDLGISLIDGHYIYKGADTVKRHVVVGFGRVSIKRWVYYLCFDRMLDPTVNLISGCGIENCVHPYHLKVVTMSEIKKSIKRKNTKLPQAKLLEEDVIKIKKLITTGMPLIELASIFKVSYNTIKGIKSGRVWSHITV